MTAIILTGYGLVNYRFIKKHIPIRITMLEKDLDAFLTGPTANLLKNLRMALWNAFIIPALTWGYWLIIAAGCLVAVSWPDDPLPVVVKILAFFSIVPPLCLITSLLSAIRKKGETI